MPNVDGTFYSGETQRPNTSPASPPNAGDEPVYPVNPPGSGNGTTYKQLGDVTDQSFIGKNGYVPVVNDENELTLEPLPQILENGLLSGGIVQWTGIGYVFNVSSAFYRIGGVAYQSDPIQLTLDTPDVTDSRIDLFAVNTSGVAIKITGTPSATPVKPQIDPQTELELTSVIVGASTTTPTLTTEVIYDENVEWAGSSTGVGTVVFNSAVNPFQGSLSIEATNIENNLKIRLTDIADYDLSTVQTLGLQIDLKSAMGAGQNIGITFLNNLGLPISTELVLVFDKSLTTYQFIGIALNQFIFTSYLARSIEFRYIRTKGTVVYSGFYLDIIKLEGGINPPIGANSFLALTDTPITYVGQASKVVTVKSDESGLEFSPGLSGYVPTTRIININGTIQDLSADRTWVVTATSGGNAVSYFLNGGTVASDPAYYQMSQIAVVGSAVNFPLAGNGLISQFLTDAGDPNRLEILAGNWNFEMWFGASSSGGTPKFYVELLKYDGAIYTSIASTVLTPVLISDGTVVTLYLTALAVPYTTLTVSDRLAVRIYIVDNILGRTITNYTQDSHLCQVITNFASGISALNGLTENTQYFDEGTAGTDFNISSVSDTHTFNIPSSSATNRGLLLPSEWSLFNAKVGGSGTANEIAYFTAANTIDSLPVATYPSLTELSYVKGVTSAIQTQLNAKPTTFLGLTDTPSTYVGQASKTVSVKADETGLEFTTGGGGADTNAVHYNAADGKTASEKQQARDNIGSPDGIPQYFTTLGSNNNFVKTNNCIIFTGAGSATLTGVVAGVDGEQICIANYSGFTLNIAGESASSTASNRFNSTFALLDDNFVIAQYSATLTRWVLASSIFLFKNTDDSSSSVYEFTDGRLRLGSPTTPNSNGIHLRGKTNTAAAQNFTVTNNGETTTFFIDGTGILSNSHFVNRFGNPTSPNANGITARGATNSAGFDNHTFMNQAQSQFFRIQGDGKVVNTTVIEHSRSNSSLTSIRRDENFLNTSENVVTAGAINNQAITAGNFNQRFTLATSITGHANGENGRELTINNANTVSCDLVYESASSTAANRYYFATLANLTIPSRGIVTLIYNSTVSRWELKSKNF